MVTPLKTLMGFSVHLNVQLKFYNLPYVIVDNELPQNARLMAEDGEQEKEYKIIISKQNSQVQQITVFYVDVPDDRLPIVKPSSGRIIDNRTQRLNVTEGQTYNNKLWDFESAGYELFKADKGANVFLS